MIDQATDTVRDALLREIREAPTTILTTLVHDLPEPRDAYTMALRRELESRATPETASFSLDGSTNEIADALGWLLENCEDNHGTWFLHELGYAVTLGVTLYDATDVTLFRIRFPEAKRIKPFVAEDGGAR